MQVLDHAKVLDVLKHSREFWEALFPCVNARAEYVTNSTTKVVYKIDLAFATMHHLEQFKTLLEAIEGEPVRFSIFGYEPLSVFGTDVPKASYKISLWWVMPL